jgi:hypothetical protein
MRCIVFAALLVAAASSLAERARAAVTISFPCQIQGTIAPAIQSILNANPNGGPALAEQIRQAVSQSPALAQDVIAAMASVSDSRILNAVAAGLAGAQIFFVQQNPQAAEQISGWMQCGSSEFQLAYALERGIQLANGGFVYGYIPLSFVGGVVSPSRP